MELHYALVILICMFSRMNQIATAVCRWYLVCINKFTANARSHAINVVVEYIHYTPIEGSTHL